MDMVKAQSAHTFLVVKETKAPDNPDVTIYIYDMIMLIFIFIHNLNLVI